MINQDEVFAAISDWWDKVRRGAANVDLKTEDVRGKLLDALMANQNDLGAYYQFESDCAEKIQQARGYYGLLDEYLLAAPSREEDDGWVKVIALTFRFEGAGYAPFVKLPPGASAGIRQALESRYPGVRIEVSKFGMVLPWGDFDLPPLTSVLAMEESIQKSSVKAGPPLVPGQNTVQLVLAANIILPWEAASDIETWEQFDEECASEIEHAKLENPCTILVPELSSGQGDLCGAGALLSEVGYALLRPVIDLMDDRFVNVLNNEERTRGILEIVLVTGEGPRLSGVPPTSISVRMKDGLRLLAETQLVETMTPAFVVGYLARHVDLYLRPGCEMRVVDLRDESA